MEINLNSIVTREAVVRALSDQNIENRQVEFVISDETPDNYGTVFKLSGWDLARYERNPIVFYQHKSSSDNPDMIIGTSTIRVDGNQLIGVVTFESAEINPLAEKIFQKVQTGTLRMASISANPKKGHWGDRQLGEDPELIYFDLHELYEWSIVALGSNPEALKRESQTIEEIKGLVIKENSQRSQNDGLNVFEAQLMINKNNL